jgi:hypothetical protein
LSLTRRRPFVRLEAPAHEAHQTIALGEEVAKPFLERALLTVRARRLGLADLELRVGAAQAHVELRHPILDRGVAILGAGDAGEQLDEPGVGRVALRLQALSPLSAGQRLRLGAREDLPLGVDGALHGPQLVAGCAALGLQRPQLLTQPVELLAASRHRVRERFTFAAPELDPALVMLDVGPQREQPLGPLAEHALAFGQLDTPFLDCQLALGETRLERRQLVA